MALEVSKRAIADKREFNKYTLIEKLFIVFPLMQSENVEDAFLFIDHMTQFIQYAESKNYKDCVDTLEIILE